MVAYKRIQKMGIRKKLQIFLLLNSKMQLSLYQYVAYEEFLLNSVGEFRKYDFWYIDEIVCISITTFTYLERMALLNFSNLKIFGCEFSWTMFEMFCNMSYGAVSCKPCVEFEQQELIILQVSSLAVIEKLCLTAIRTAFSSIIWC